MCGGDLADPRHIELMTDAESPQSAHDVGFGAPAERRRVLEVLGHAELTGSSVGIVHLDVDGFHRVNARFGQAVGNEVLAVLRNRLTDEVGAGGIVVAADGDAFVVVLPAVDAEGTRAAAARLLDVVRRPIPVGDHVVTVHASAGTAWRAVGDQPIDLVEDAFLACRQAKATAPGTVVGYEGALGAEAERRQRVEDELRRAIAFDELVLHVQPEIRSDGAVIGVEALVRWQHPTAGLLPPAAFLPEAEATRPHGRDRRVGARPSDRTRVQMADAAGRRAAAGVGEPRRAAVGARRTPGRADASSGLGRGDRPRRASASR